MEGQRIPNGKRNEERAYIVAIGMTGAGKSTTINVLFDQNSANPDDVVFTSNTQSILEYQVDVATQNDGKTQELIVIDTPGFRDTIEEDHYVKDSRIMATISAYFDNHKDLRECFPNAVLLIVKFDDNSIVGEKSDFIQFLKALEKLIENHTLIDTGSTTCNLVLVLTHFMNAEDQVKLPEPRIKLLQGLLKTFTSIPSNTPVVLAENKGKEFKLIQVSGYSELPNGELYPFNLFRAIQNIAFQSADDVGESILTDAFRDPLKLKKTLIADVPLLPADDPESRAFYYPLRNSDNVNEFETEVSRTLQRLSDEISLVKTKEDIIGLKIAKAIFHRENIDMLGQIPKTAVEIVNLLSQLPVNGHLEKVLVKLGINAPSLGYFGKSIGYFYNITNDTLTGITPFKDETNKMTEIGFTAPAYMRADPVRNANSRKFISSAKIMSRKYYVAERLRTLRVGLDPEKPHDINIAPLAGYNVLDPNMNPDEITGVREFREYAVSMTNSFKFQESYIEAIKKLPSISRSSMEIWSSHFSSFGSHILQFGYLGGYVKITAKRVCDAMSDTPIDDVIDHIDDILEHIGESEEFDRFEEVQDWEFAIQYFGGDVNISKPINLAEVFSVEGKEAFEQWCKSLQIYPTLLLSELHVEHISAYLKNEHYHLSEKVSDAAMSVMKCKKYVDLDKPVERANVGRRCVIL